MIFRSVVMLCALASAAPAMAADQRFSIGNFEELIVEGDIQVNVQTGKAPSAIGSGPREKLNALRVERQGKVVRIRSNGFTSASDKGGPLSVTITGRGIRRLALIGSGKITADTLDSENMRIDLRGSGTIEVASLKAFKLVTMLTGNGMLKIAKGEIFNSEVVMDGGVNFISAGLVSQNLKLVQSGPASTLLTVSKIAEINNSGTGSITIEGDGTCLVRKAGSGKINCKKMSK